MSRTRITLVSAAAIAAVFALAGCSSNSGTGSMPGMDMSTTPTTAAPSTNDAHNDSDVAFATGMIPHHEQAVEMADMVLKKTGIDKRVIALATKIKAAQDPEIVTMTGWLKSWGAPDAGSMGSMPGMDMGNGMMSDKDMKALDAASGVEASKLFLTQMTQHHEGAISMAKTEVADGKNKDAIDLANNIITSQTAEIAEMGAVLAGL